jgi:hypothetical protein
MKRRLMIMSDYRVPQGADSKNRTTGTEEGTQVTVLRIPFAGDAGTAALTWGQIAIWDVLHWAPPGDATLNQAGTCPIPQGRTTEDVAEAVRVLLERHESLRTLYYATPTGEVQQVLGAGDLLMTVHDISEEVGTSREAADGHDVPEQEAACAALSEWLRARPFEIGQELPIRAALAVAGGRPVAVILAASHMAVDGWSFRIVCDDLAALLDPSVGPLPPPGQQPRDRVAFEHSDAGQWQEETALDYWRDAVRHIPPVMLASARSGPEPDLEWARMSSPAMAPAVAHLAREAGVRPALVVEAVLALLLAAYSGESDVALRTIVATRFQPGARRLVGAFNQNGLFRIALADPIGTTDGTTERGTRGGAADADAGSQVPAPVPARPTNNPGPESVVAFIKRVHTATLLSYRYCEYHPRKLEESVAQVADARGFAADGYCFFNDVVQALGRDELRDVPETSPGPTRIETFANERPAKGANLFVFLNELTGAVKITLCLERAFLAPLGAADLLRDIERLTALAAVPGADVPAVCQAVLRSAATVLSLDPPD